MIVFPNCKLNLGLHILQKRPDGFHNLETIFYPIHLQDTLEIIYSDNGQELTFTSSGNTIDAPVEQISCVKAWKLLKRDHPSIPDIKMHLHKVIPSGAGLGGGSADGAFALMLLNNTLGLKLSKEQLSAYALQLGSDCPFFLINRPCLAKGRGEKMELLPIDLSRYTIALINPQIHISTAWAFSQVKPVAERPSLKEVAALPVEQWKHLLHNDFEEAVFQNYPPIRSIKETLYKEGAVYASMSGSGSTVFGLFDQIPDLKNVFPAYYFIRMVTT